jgi:DNA-binding ferritin-like protein (Dps family)
MGNYFKSMFNNEFDILVKENKLRSEYLSVENKSILKKLVNRLSVSKLSAFDIQTTQKDFIGMALEAEQRGETLSNVLGNDMNSFCDEIIKNGRKKGCKEAIIMALPSVLFCLTFMYGIIYILLNSCPTIMKITLHDSFLYLFWCFIGIPLGNYLSGKTAFESKFKKTLSYWIFLGFFVFIIISDNIFSSKHIVLFEVIGWVPLVVMFVLLMVSYFLRNNYLSSLAKRYNWSDS